MTAPTVTERGRLTALRAAWLFDGTGSALIPDPLVVIDGGTIVAVDSGVAAPDGADVVDLGGAALLPGLVDTHVHLAFDASADPVGALAGRDDEQATEAMIRAGQTALRGGVTTVRDLGDRDYLSLGLRGQPGLPTIVAAGPPVTTPGGHCHYLGGVAEPTEAGVRAAVREHVEHGVDVIKIMASGGTLTPGTCQHLPQFTAEVLRAAVDEAHRHGLQVTAHAHAVAGDRGRGGGGGRRARARVVLDRGQRGRARRTDPADRGPADDSRTRPWGWCRCRAGAAAGRPGPDTAASWPTCGGCTRPGR